MSSNGDRSWMYDRLNERGCLNHHFEVGVSNFVEFAFSHSSNLLRGKVRCPCRKCCNTKYQKRDVIYTHLYKWGFVAYYTLWVAHGEMSDNFSSHHNTSNVHEAITHSNRGAGDDQIRNMIDDAFGGQYRNIYYNDNLNEEPNSKEAKAFFEMLRENEMPVNMGGESETTVLRWVSQFMSTKTTHKFSTVGCDKMIEHVHELVTPEVSARVPKSVYKMKKLMKSLGLGVKTFDACINNCFLFYGDFIGPEYTSCLECGEDRYEPDHDPDSRKKPIPRKKLWYFPLTPRLQRLYMSRSIAEHMTWHTNCREDRDHMIHPAAGDAWKYFDAMHPDFAAESRNVRLGLCTDGFTPWGSSAGPYSCWPVFVTPYNLPPDMCMRQEFIFLSLLISGPQSPGKNIDVFLRPLIDELISLWNTGVPTYDSFRRQNFQLRASVLWTISDFPAYGMLSQWSTHGKLSCPYCMEHTKAFQLTHGRKTSFFDCHRRFLPMDHHLRQNETDFWVGEVESDPPLRRRNGTEMEVHVAKLPNVGFGKCRERIEGFGTDHNWCRRSIFWELPYWSTNLIRHNLDVMHCEKNFFENIKNTVMDDPEKTKDNIKARKDLKELTSRSELFLVPGQGGKDYKPHAIYCLTRAQKKYICEWLRALKFPDGYASNIGRCVQMHNLRLTGMKSHDCHVFLQRLIPIAFRDFLKDEVWGPLVEISNFFKALCATNIKRSDMEKLEISIVETMCKLETIFPPSFFDSMEHLAIHLPWEAKVGGPVQYRWMYPFQRRMLELKGGVGNRARIEGSISEAYLTSEMTNFCDHYFDVDVDTRRTRLNRNETRVDPNSSSQLSIFRKIGEPLGKASTERLLTNQEYGAAELYILLNCPEVDCWIRVFDEENCTGLQAAEIHELRNVYFVPWFRDMVLSSRFHVDPRLRALAIGPIYRVTSWKKGYKINGLRFHTEVGSRGKKTTNTGVCVKWESGEEGDTFFYGTLNEVLELEYPGEMMVVLFKCTWFDTSDRGMRVHPNYRLIDIDPRRRLPTGESEPFILASQAQQVYYAPYHAEQHRQRRGWWAVFHTPARHVVDLSSMTASTSRVQPPQDIYQEAVVPVDGLFVDLASFNLTQLAVDGQFEEVAEEDEEPAKSSDEDEPEEEVEEESEADAGANQDYDSSDPDYE